jgi:chaperone required for assembly of F1-ATPase
MKRFYEAVSVDRVNDGYAIALDARRVKTPRSAPLILPTLKLAKAVAAEWTAQGENIDPQAMKLTGLANAAIDVIAPDVAMVHEQIGAYAETDVLVYRGNDSTLLARQIAEWNPLLDAAERRWGIQFNVTSGIMHVAQPPETVAALRHEIAACDAWQLAALSSLTTIGGSLIVALGVLDQTIQSSEGWAAVILEEIFQEECWGSDEAARLARSARERDWSTAARFARLLDG